MRRFYSAPENFASSMVVLDSEQSRHLRSVLRLRPGDEVSVFDGLGSEFLCVVEETGNAKVGSNLRVVSEIESPSRESSLELILGVALLKSDKLDLVIQKSVELGVSEFVPLNTKRCDAKIKQFENKMERFERIVIEASKQCGRAKLMKISKPFDFDSYAANASGTKILFAEKNGIGFPDIRHSKKVTALVGPEGGWEDSESEIAAKNGFQIITLGGRILRAETAVISIATLLQYKFGDLS